MHCTEFRFGQIRYCSVINFFFSIKIIIFFNLRNNLTEIRNKRKMDPPQDAELNRYERLKELIKNNLNEFQNIRNHVIRLILRIL